MSEENKRVVRRMLEMQLNDDRDGLSGVTSPGWIGHIVSQTISKEQFIASNSGMASMASDWSYTIEEQIAESGKVATRLVWQATHDKVIEGIPPTGRTFQQEVIRIDHIVEGVIVESWAQFDPNGIRDQLVESE